MMEALEFIILTWLASFVPAAYFQMVNSSSEPICNLTILKENSTYPRPVLNVLQYKLIDRCPKNYTNETIITSCEHFDFLESLNLDVYTPATDNITNITYANKYCGYCNNYNDTRISNLWSSWSPTYVYLKNKDGCENYKSEIKASEVDDLDKWTQTFINNGMTLKTSSYLRNLECTGKKNWPIKLLYWVIPCLVQYYQSGQDDRLKSCQYFDKNDRSCVKMDFIIEGRYFDYRSKFYNGLSQINLTGGDYLVQTRNDDIFYMCKQIYKVGYWGKFALIIASVAFLFVYLILNFNKRHFQILPNQLLYIYSIGLIVMYVLLTYIYLKFPISYVSFSVAKIFWTYQFIWATLILIVFCHMAFSMCRCENKSERGATIFYLSILFFFGLLLPVSLPIMYLNFLNSHENQCPLISGHSAFTDIPFGNLEFMKFILNTSLGFFMPAIFLVGIFCTWCNKGEDEDGRRSARYTENAPTVLRKMLIIMGIHYVLYKLCLGYYGNENSYTILGLAINMDIVAQLSIDIHGVLVFFVFLTDNTMINDFLITRGYKLGNTTRQNGNGATETTMEFQS